MPSKNTKNPYLKTNSKKSTPIKVPYSPGQDMIGFYDSWINSPEYKKRLTNNKYSSPNKTQSNRSNSLSNMVLTHDLSLPSMANAPGTPGSKSFVNINEDEVSDIGANKDSVKAHEISHIMGSKPNAVNSVVGFNDYEEDIIKNSIINKPSVGSRHTIKPEEIKADLDASRWNLFNKGVYDIREGQPFTKDHLMKARDTFEGDDTFNRLIDQVGDDNYINLMNTIASTSNQTNTQMAKFGGFINPLKQEQMFLGGMMGSGFNPGELSQGAGSAMGMLSEIIPQQNKDGMTSVGGGALSGAMKGVSAGAMLGPLGAGIGALGFGAMGLINAKKQRAEEEESLRRGRNIESRGQLASMNYGASQSSNLPMAGGGYTNPVESNIGDFTSFNGGGTHEQNPNGGIPMGTNNESGQQITVEDGETQYNFKEGKYVFSNRIKIDQII